MAKRLGFTHESTHNESQEWYTPKPIFRALGVEFDVDPCSPGKDVVPWVPAKRHITAAENGLTSDWGTGIAFVNPPYGMDTPAWMKRLMEHGNGIGLVFSRTDTSWFHDYAVKADAILFIRSRIKFVQAEHASWYAKGVPPKGAGCGAGSMLIAYGKQAYEALVRADSLGHIFIPCGK
jgi:hypothetical protein